MKEIRLHGRGGMGTVKASEIIVYANIAKGGYGNSIPFFGFERQGAPVTAFVKIDDKPIRPKTQVYKPDCIIIMDPTIRRAVDIYEGIKKDSILVINSVENLEELSVPANIGRVAVIDATSLALKRIGKIITNTAMLGAFVRGTAWVELEDVVGKVREFWGDINADIVKEAYEQTIIYDIN
jgi:2-oxoacid:acceptor oxidoreductase gamma subunit (pyruvate/2-ketoisovalerate family)